MKKSVPFVILLVLLSLPPVAAQSGKTGAELVAEATRSIKAVTAAEAQRMTSRQKVVVIDVREAEECVSGMLPGAVNIARGLLEFSIESVAPDRGTTIIVYCKKGGRAALAAQTLQIMGYRDVSNLLGGIESWIAAELPVKKPK